MYRNTDLEIDLIRRLQEVRNELIATFDDNFKRQGQTLDLITMSVKHASFNSFRQNEIVWNVAGYINILSFDLKVATKNLLVSNHEWERRYFARQMALLVYEGINDLYGLLGKEFREVLSTFSECEVLLDILKKCLAKMNIHKEKYLSILKEIRNVSIAHRDRSSLEQIRIIQSLSWASILECCTEFDNIVNELGALLQRTIDKCVSESKELTKRN